MLVHMVEHFRVGELHRVLRGLDEWLDDDEADTVTGRMLDGLRDCGLLERDGRLDREFVDTLATLCHPSLAYFGWLIYEGTRREVLAAQLGREAVLAVREGEQVVLYQLREGELVTALLGQLPKANPAQFQPIQLREPQRRETGEVMVEATYTKADEQDDILRRLVEATNYGGAELFVETRDRAGRVSTSDNSLGYTIGEYGAWLNCFQRDQYAQRRLFAAPASSEALHRHIRSLDMIQRRS